MAIRPMLFSYFREQEISKEGFVTFRIEEYGLMWLHRKPWNAITCWNATPADFVSEVDGATRTW